MSQPDYRSVRGKLTAREKQCRRSIKHMLRRHRGFIPSGIFPPDDDDLDTMVAQIVAATGLAGDRSKQRGFDGYKYAIMTTQLKYSKGFSSKGKKYALRIYLVTALELFLYLAETEGEANALDAVITAAQGNILTSPVYADKMARIWKWDREFHDHYAVWAALILDGLSGASLHEAQPWENYDPNFTDGGPWNWNHWRQQQERRRTEREWRREREYDWSRHTSPEPEPEPRPYRSDEWAYTNEPALNDGRTWQQVLFGNEVPYTTIDDIERQWKKKMLQVHPDVGGTNDEAAAANAAWRVAQKVMRYH